MTILMTRCDRCYLEISTCFCSDLLPPIPTPHRLSLLVHYCEHFKKASNSSHLLPLTFLNSKVFWVGKQDELPKWDQIILKDHHNLFLFPFLSVPYLQQKQQVLDPSKPINLIIPDGTWKQARRMYRRNTILHQVPLVQLPNTLISNFHLRTSPHPTNLCTFEAAAYSMKMMDQTLDLALVFGPFIEFSKLILQERAMIKELTSLNTNWSNSVSENLKGFQRNHQNGYEYEGRN